MPLYTAIKRDLGSILDALLLDWPGLQCGTLFIQIPTHGLVFT